MTINYSKLSDKQKEIAEYCINHYDYIDAIPFAKHLKEQFGDTYMLADIIRAYKAIDWN